MHKLQEMFGLAGLGRINGGVEQRGNENSMNRVRGTRGDGGCKSFVYLDKRRFSRGRERDIIDGCERRMGESFREIERMAEGRLVYCASICSSCGLICCWSGSYLKLAFRRQ